MLDIRQIVTLQSAMVERWHLQPIDNPYASQTGLLPIICQQHQFNFLLWHEEDIARSPSVGDAEIARVKRAIDRFNQQRNDWIEKIDDKISQMIESRNLTVQAHASMNTETPGSAIDRLSILSLRIYHLQDQLTRTDVDEHHRTSVQQKLEICRIQQQDLSRSLQQLVTAIFSGVKRHRTYRQLKMYNDAQLNPYLYQSTGQAAEQRRSA